MTSSFDTLLDASAPPVTPRTPELERELAVLISEAEAIAAPVQSRLRRRILIGGLATIGVLGIGATASATGALHWFDDPATQNTQVTSNGASCEVKYGTKEHEPKHPVDDTTRAAAVAAAETFLRDFDFSTIDVGEAAKKLPPRVTAGSERPGRGRSAGETGPAQTVDEYETSAVHAELGKRLSAYLARQGLPADAVTVAMAISCDGGRR